MPQPVVAGYFTYPGLPPLIAGEYTCSHGITPGTIVLRTHPSNVSPAAFGNVKIGDGRKEFTLHDCKLIRFTAERDDSGNEWIIELEDARWRWRGGWIDGMYNQLDPHGKLIPRMVRSPTELANLCLDLMGVKSRFVDMPDGISSKDALANTPDFLSVGVNFPARGINPPVNWYSENPAGALASLAEICGRRVVYDPINARVLVVRPGDGNDLPNGHIHNVTPSMVAPETPDAVGLVGDPTRYETMFELQAVGIEWDGSVRPINELSYTPVVPGKFHAYTFVVNKPTGALDGYVFNFRVQLSGENNQVEFSYTAQVGDDAAAIYNGVMTAFGGTLLGKYIDVYLDGDGLTFESLEAGSNFDMCDYNTHMRGSVRLLTAGAKESRSWKFSPAPTYPNVIATPRLTRLQATALAARGVWRMYRLTGRDATSLTPPIKIPQYGDAIRQDIILLDECCEQVVPVEGDRRFTDLDGKPFIATVYDGYSRSKPAEVYGSVARTCTSNGEHWFIGDGLTNAGAAAVGGAVVPAAPPPVPRAVALYVIFGVTGSTYNVKLSVKDEKNFGPGGFDYQNYDIVAATNDPAAITLQINTAFAASTFFAKYFTSTIENDGNLIVTGVNAGVEFTATSTTSTTYLSTTIVKTGSGAAKVETEPQLEVGPRENKISPSISGGMTPVGNGKGGSLNTDPSDRVYVDFSVDATWQMIIFNSAVWFAGEGMTIQEPKLFLRTACHVRDPDTQQLDAYYELRRFRPGDNIHVIKRPDVQLNVIGEYEIGIASKGLFNTIAELISGSPGPTNYIWKLIKDRLLEEDAKVRAKYYLDSELLQFKIKGGVITEYNGIEPIRMDGKTQQVTYKVVGGTGTMTTASSNMEHSTWYPPYPARRRAENLAAMGRAGGAGGNGRADNPQQGSRTPLPPGSS